jgi:hypothetical protein
MLHPLFRTLVKVIFASLIVGTVMTQFGITVDQVMRETGMSPERNTQDRVSPGPAECPARSPGDRSDLVCGLSVPPARQKQQ